MKNLFSRFADTFAGQSQPGPAAHRCDIAIWISPNLGILDSWMPVLRELKQGDRSLTVAALIPYRNVVSQFRPGDLMTELGECTFDLVLERKKNDVWHLHSSLRDIVREKPRVTTSAPEANHFGNGTKRQDWDLRDPNRQSSEPSPRSSEKLSDLVHGAKAILYDVVEEKKRDVRELDAAFHGASWFSLPHGIDLRTEKLEPDSVDLTLPGEKEPRKIIAYASSKSECEAYKKAFGLHDEYIRPIGVPRHSPQWQSDVRRFFGSASKPPEEFVLLVSRRSNPRFFPEDRKRLALRAIKELVMDELGMKILIRMHPREREIDMFDECLNAEDRDKKWFLTSDHPIALSERSLMCVSFFSSVAVDMAALGIPVIEFFDFDGLQELPQTVKKSGGDAKSIYELSGLALGARNSSEFRRQTMKILKDHAAASKDMKQAYETHYEILQNPSAEIADDIKRDLIARPDHSLS